MRRIAPRCGAIAWFVFASAALALPAGDPTPGTLAPLVVIVSPMDGAVVGRSARIQARVQSPSGVAAISSVSVSIAGASTSTSTVSLARNPSSVLGADRGVYEAIVQLAPGRYTLVASATDTAARSTSSAAVSVVANADGGDGYLLVREDSSPLCTACHALPDHGSEAAGRAYGAWTTTCRDCHATHGTRNTHLVRETITPPWVAGAEAPQPRPVRLSKRNGYAAAGGPTRPGDASFANGDGSGPCQVCHTRTSRWRADGTADAVHLGDCAFCHRHQTGMKARCEDCHPAPPSTGAHAAHHGPSAPSPPFPSDPRPLGCGSCHPVDPALHGDGVQQVTLDPDLVLPGGTRTAGARIAGSSTATSCTVACHFPLGAPAPAQAVTWSDAGPLPCTSCHARIDPGGLEPGPRAGPSLHDPVFSEARPASGEPTTCWSCHDSASHDATHLTGDAGLLSSGTVNATCIACHSPPSGPSAGAPGQVLHRGSDAATSWTPPVLPGWSEETLDATIGDFHGGRRGTCFDPNKGPVPCAPTTTPTGFGGTLLAPYYRGYPAMPCTTCHAGHASRNAFMLAPVVNGTTIPAGSIDRAGVGAEKLCEACHAGGRHDRCTGCHTNAYACDDYGQCWMDSAATHVDPAPAGSACFFCHGHEGMTTAWRSPFGPHGVSGTDCGHCHASGWANSPSDPPLTVPPSYTAPLLGTGSMSVSGITSSSANLAWYTTKNASSQVEYGVGMPNYVTGSTALTTTHSVALSGLAPGTTYVWRARSVDAHRNVLRTSLSTFTTIAEGGVPHPDIVKTGSVTVEAPQTTTAAALQWYPVASPTGNPVEYRVQLASDTTFTTLLNGSPPDSGWISGAPTIYFGKPVLYFQVTLTNLPLDDCGSFTPNSYYWRVKARDSITGVESDWSAVDLFWAWSYLPYC
ncbi:cytochrome c3 family protein [Anaeromyxobacter oryzisoli]|uniref:cytochrome c3 family protein n=1 Tax=Anaeromyxobacter oryzisoli TaxID=2925408 RepID=UPI001F59C773|nr:cytochrome c3 family protein [Anaeromyxobacter sp. SG63]